MSKKQNGRLEKHIYVEERSGSLRFKVVVPPFQDSATFSTMDEGARWARRRRVELLESRASNKELALPERVHVVSASSGFPHVPKAPLSIKLSDVFDSYQQNDLPKLTGKDAEASRLERLRKWFGERTVDQLDEALIDKWKASRLAGKLGSGRDPNRAATMSTYDGAKPLTKHQRYARNKAGKEVPSLPIYPVSTQTARHELNLLRRSVTKYLNKENRWPIYGAWWQAHSLMRMQLPDSAEPRNRRVSDDELLKVFNSIEDMTLKSAILFSILTSLRRGEIVSLQWEDVDFQRMVVRLRKPGFLTKTKVHAREVPLLPGAVKLLQDLIPKKSGPIFPMPATDLSHGWRNAADKAEIYDARLHDCRREAISRLVETCQLRMHEVVLFSGHSDMRTLEKHYLRLDSGRMAARLAENPDAINMAPSL
ncbi:site-specific integrase [Janthinobacterium sp. PSPC3-1]|uniref:site-specific integrase n=1 Tax=Janthinobacterium sp. PSPC3-1 TaxID=2804653 RepID=UPI003CF22282